MPNYKLHFELMSAATFGRGDGVAGLVDREVEHDACGLPYLRGKTLRGLLAEECAQLLVALVALDPGSGWRQVAIGLFGSPGSKEEDRGRLRVGDATMPPDFCTAVRIAQANREMTAADVLEALTSIRRQTAMSADGAPAHGSLRAMRVVLPGTTFEAVLSLPNDVNPRELALLGACILAWRRAGTGRNRGRGRLRAWLVDEAGQDISADCLMLLQQELPQ
jgi:hypothetical protein